MADLSSLLADAGQPCGQPLPDVDSLGILDDLWWSSGAELTPSGLGAPPAAAPSAPAADTELDKRRAQNRAAMQRFRQRQRQRQQEQQQRREEQVRGAAAVPYPRHPITTAASLAPTINSIPGWLPCRLMSWSVRAWSTRQRSASMQCWRPATV